MSKIRFQLSDGGADDLGDAIDQSPFSADLKGRIWRELLGSPDAFPCSPDGVFEIGVEAAVLTSEGFERDLCAIPFRLGRRGKILLAAFRALRSDAVGADLDHAERCALAGQQSEAFMADAGLPARSPTREVDVREPGGLQEPDA